MGIFDKFKINKSSDESSNEWGNKKTSKATEKESAVLKNQTPLLTEYDDLDYNQTRHAYGGVIFRDVEFLLWPVNRE